MSAEFTQSEILNEVSKLFRAQLDPGRDGGTLNVKTEYEQLLELSSITFLLNNDAVFYLALLARNKLYGFLKSEIALVEDMLVALNDLSQIGSSVKDVTTLSNANTALLALDASGSVLNRPETQRFSDLMDKFAAQYRGNIVSRATGDIVRPREDARNILRLDLSRLKSQHDLLLQTMFSLRDLMDNFVSLDIPSKVAATTLKSVRDSLSTLSEDMVTDDTATNISKSRQSVLTTLASKVAVNVISQFTDPRRLKVRTPINPLPSNIRHLGRVTGEGEAAYLISGPGPWALPISEPLVLSVNQATAITVDLDTILGATLNGRTAQNFYPDADQESLHVIVDPEVRTGTLTGATTISSVVTSEQLPLGFKHLGSTVVFPGAYVNSGGAPFYRNLSPRLITEHRKLQGFTVTSFDSSLNMVQLETPTIGDEPAGGLVDSHVGAYLLQNISGQNYRWEILEVVHPDPPDPTHWYAILSVPEVVGSPVTPQASATCELRGQSATAGGTKFTFYPPHETSPATGSVQIGPSVKTASFTTPGPRTAAQMIADIRNNLGHYNVPSPGDYSQALNSHVKVSEVAGSPGRLALTIRSKQSPYIKISDRFLKVSTTISQPDNPVPLTFVSESAHELLGLRVGESDTTDILTPAELVGWINQESNGAVEAEVVETELVAGDGLELSFPDDPAEVEHPTITFDETVQVGDLLELFSEEPGNTGVFQITLVAGGRLVLDRPAFSGSGVASFRIFRQQVKISTVKVTRGCSIEMTSGPSELGFATGVQYGRIPKFEAVDNFGELWKFSGISPGDTLRIVGSSELTPILSVDDTALTLETGLSSNLENVGFEVQSGAAAKYNQLQDDLSTFTQSGVLLPKHHYDENLDELDSALTTALLPGQSFTANRNKAKQLLMDLLSILTSTPLRASEYPGSPPVASMNLQGILNAYVVSAVPALDSLITAFEDRKYDRAVDLLRSGQILEFYDTDEETGSYGGAMISASRSVVKDLPKSPSLSYAVQNELGLASGFQEVPDADDSFDDQEEEEVE